MLRTSSGPMSRSMLSIGFKADEAPQILDPINSASTTSLPALARATNSCQVRSRPI
ncbi:hypothetical protein P3T24_006560 [Paraburkholderia sp. GAS33]